MQTVRILSAVAFAAAAFALSPAPASADAGQDLFNKHCKNCHRMEPGKHTLGPSLANIVGKPAGQQDFDRYKGLKGADFAWTEENLDAWLANPKEFLGKSTSMVSRVKDANDRKAIIEYLKAN